jgi:hypothetical protein
MEATTKFASLYFKRLNNGNWGIVSDAPLDLDETVEVPTKNGTLKAATPKNIIWSGKNDDGTAAYLYAIKESEPSAEKASQAQVQEASKAMALAAGLQERLNKASKAFGDLQGYIHALEARVEALEARLASQEPKKKASKKQAKPAAPAQDDVPWDTAGLEEVPSAEEAAA